MEIINLTEILRNDRLASGNGRSMINFFLLAAVAENKEIDNADGEKLEVKLIVNGVDCDVQNSFNRLDEYWNEAIEKKGKEIALSLLQHMMNKIEFD